MRVTLKPALKRMFRAVLSSIEESRLKDLERIRRRLEEVRYFDAGEPGTLGEVKRVDGGAAQYEDWSQHGSYFVSTTGYFSEEPHCVLWLSDELDTAPEWKRRAIIAHELGHVAMTPEAIERRNAPSDERASESAADWFACRCGFRRDLGRYAREGRSLGHRRRYRRICLGHRRVHGCGFRRAASKKISSNRRSMRHRLCGY